MASRLREVTQFTNTKLREVVRFTQRRPEVVLGGIGVLALASLAVTGGLNDVGTVFSNVQHGHGLFDSFGTYHTIAHPEHLEASPPQIIPHGKDIPAIVVNGPQGSDWTIVNVSDNPDGSGSLVETVTTHFLARPSETVFTPFSTMQDVRMGADVAVMTSIAGSGIRALGKITRRK